MLNVGFEFDDFSFSLFGLFDLLDLASLSTTSALSFLGSLALFCCARLPKMMRWNGKKGAHEQPSAMVSTSPITASSCSSPGCCGSVAVARSFFARSLHRHSTARAVLRQKKKGLNERATAAEPNFAWKYSLESSRRDLHNALLCTILFAQISVQKKCDCFADLLGGHFTKCLAQPRHNAGATNNYI